MAIERMFTHPMATINRYRAAIKRALRESRPLERPKPVIPSLSKDMDYYFVFESVPREDLNSVLYGITCFDSDGIILFEVKGTYPVSLWRFRRQGIARSATMFEGIVKSVFRQKNVPLHKEEPFRMWADGIFLCNISWFNYQSLLKL